MGLLNSVLWIIGVVCAVWVIYDVWTSKEKTGMKVLWTVLAILFSIITAIVYYFVKKR